MKSPFDTPRNHRLLADGIRVLVQLHGENGLMGVTAKKRYKAVNDLLVRQGREQAGTLIKEQSGACKIEALAKISSIAACCWTRRRPVNTRPFVPAHSIIPARYRAVS